MDPIVARKTWRTLEPLHGLVYFAPEAFETYAAVGLDDVQDSYFASRSAPMGAVGAEVVIATFFNFAPGIVRRALPAAWERVTPTRLVEARFEAVDRILRRTLPDAIGSAEMAEVAGLVRRAAAACRPEGRPLAAAHAAVAWPDEPHLVLWHGQSILREFRGDGHVAVLTSEGLTGIEANVIHAGTGDLTRRMLQSTRRWTDEEWDAAADGLRSRGWLDGGGALTDAGRAHRQAVEDRTDRLALEPYAALGEDSCDRLRALARPWSTSVVAGGGFGAAVPAPGGGT